MTVRTLLCGMLAWLMLFVAGAASAQGACSYPYPVGYAVTTIAGLRVALWYPTLSTPGPYAYNSHFSGVVAKDASPACGPVPLAIFSHGLGGCGTQSLFFTEELARHGYVVAAPDHQDATFCTVDNTRGSFRSMRPQQPLRDPSLWTDQTYVDRRDNLEDLIDALLADLVYGSQIDANAIGAAGHSLGGYTVVGLAGGWPGWKTRASRPCSRSRHTFSRTCCSRHFPRCRYR
jgi:predicted dienelactone hydrolase